MTPRIGPEWRALAAEICRSMREAGANQPVRIG
jgi:hypothetical protein